MLVKNIQFKTYIYNLMKKIDICSTLTTYPVSLMKITPVEVISLTGFFIYYEEEV